MSGDLAKWRGAGKRLNLGGHATETWQWVRDIYTVLQKGHVARERWGGVTFGLRACTLVMQQPSGLFFFYHMLYADSFMNP